MSIVDSDGDITEVMYLIFINDGGTTKAKNVSCLIEYFPL